MKTRYRLEWRRLIKGKVVWLDWGCSANGRGKTFATKERAEEYAEALRNGSECGEFMAPLYLCPSMIGEPCGCKIARVVVHTPPTQEDLYNQRKYFEKLEVLHNQSFLKICKDEHRAYGGSPKSCNFCIEHAARLKEAKALEQSS